MSLKIQQIKIIMKGIVIGVSMAIIILINTISIPENAAKQGLAIQSAFLISIGFGISICMFIWSKKIL